MSDNLDFFAVLGNSHSESDMDLQRIELGQILKAELSGAFKNQMAVLCHTDLERVKFDGRYSVSKEELFSIGDFPLPQIYDSAVSDSSATEPFKVADVDPSSIRAVVGISKDAKSNKITAIFQEFRQSKVLRKDSWAFLQSSDAFVRLDKDVFTLSNACDAVFNDGHLYFRSYYSTNRFLDLSEYFKDATDTEIKVLLEHPKLTVDDADALILMADSTIRRKFNIVQSTAILDAITPRKIKASAEAQGLPLTVTISRKDGKEALLLPSKKSELKDVLTYLCEGIYLGPLTGAVFRSNSHRPFAQPSKAKTKGTRKRAAKQK